MECQRLTRLACESTRIADQPCFPHCLPLRVKRSSSGARILVLQDSLPNAGLVALAHRLQIDVELSRRFDDGLLPSL
jgi:hypothetical protein